MGIFSSIMAARSEARQSKGARDADNPDRHRRPDGRKRRRPGRRWCTRGSECGSGECRVHVLGGTALAQQGLLWRPLALGVLVGWVVGAALFSGDIATRAVAGHRLFAMAAPTGGVILITAWLALIAAAFGSLLHRG